MNGHGYPEHVERFTEGRVILNFEELEKFLKLNANKKVEVFKATPMYWKLQTTIDLKLHEL